VGHSLGPEGNGVSSGEGGEGGPGPPSKEEDKQSTPSKEGGNMEQEEEGRTSQAWWRGTSVHRVSIFKKVFNYVIKCTLMMLLLRVCLFQENKSFGVKPICIHPLMSRHHASLRHVWHTSELFHDSWSAFIMILSNFAWFLRYMCTMILRSFALFLKCIDYDTSEVNILWTSEVLLDSVMHKLWSSGTVHGSEIHIWWSSKVLHDAFQGISYDHLMFGLSPEVYSFWTLKFCII
jgi:hypothetical protein